MFSAAKVRRFHRTIAKQITERCIQITDGVIFPIFYAKLCLILAGSHAKNALHVAGEVVGGVEIQLIGYIRNRQVFAFQQAGNFFGSEVLDEETGIMTARLDAAFREVIGCDIQACLGKRQSRAASFFFCKFVNCYCW